MKIDENNMDDVMYNAVESKDEKLMKQVILFAMKVFVSNKDYTKENLDNTASIYMSAPIDLGGEHDFEFTDRKLRYVLEELSSLEEKSDLRAHDIVKRCIAYLENRDYDGLPD